MLLSQLRIASAFHIVMILVMSLLNFRCSTPPPAQSEKVRFATSFAAGNQSVAGQTLTRADLQNALLRFETQFTARTHDTFRQLLQSQSNTIRHRATRANLTYAITSLEIALGPIPEQNLLDMLTYLELIRVVFRDYWIPRLYEEAGRPVLRGFDQSFQELQEIAAFYLTSEQLTELQGLADGWHERNPSQVSVETVRLSDFSSKAGARAKQLQRQVSGLFAPIAGALAASFEALQLAERGLYYGQRVPTLLAMQSTATLQDALKEVSSSTSEFIPTEAHVGLARRVEAEIKRLIQVLFLGALALIVFAGLVYVLARLSYDRFSRKQPQSVSRDDRRKAA